MQVFKDFIQTIENKDHQEKFKELLTWVSQAYPQLEPVIKWNQPMFTHHGTYIIGFSVSKTHIAVAPEQKTMLMFKDDIIRSGYGYGKMIVRFPWDQAIDYDLIKKFIEYNFQDKKDTNLFWRK
ncbi:DUF1801 domain-containing protein [Mycoplasmatota bacterium]|nr:DUF1801 domain-containing protein [Mycoplasmatota bacterium]